MNPSRCNPWPASLLALGLAFTAALGVTVHWGINRGSRVSDPHYYARGLAYGALLEQELATRGWQAQASWRRPELHLEVRDASGTPLPDLAGILTVQAPDDSIPSHYPLLPGPHPGSYRAKLDDRSAQGVQATVELRRDGALLRRNLLLGP